jgi:hypothetical protein
MGVLTAALYLCNPELDCLKPNILIGKLCLQSDCNLAGFGSLIPEKFDDYPLIILHPKGILNGF